MKEKTYKMNCVHVLNHISEGERGILCLGPHTSNNVESEYGKFFHAYLAIIIS